MHIYNTYNSLEERERDSSEIMMSMVISPKLTSSQAGKKWSVLSHIASSPWDKRTLKL